MTASEIAAHLFQACETLSDFDAYMFGSTLHGIGADIDILIVGPPGDGLAQLKEELRTAGHCLPLHLLFLQPSEVERTDFIRRANCVPLASLASAVRGGHNMAKQPGGEQMDDVQPSPTDQRRTAQIILDPTVVRSLTDVAMQDALAIIACALPALEIADMVTPVIPGATITMTFPARPEEIAFRRARCRAWLLTKGLHEITRAVRMSLELAYCYVKIVELFRNGLVPAETYNEQDALFRKTANKLPFPELLKRVGEALEMPLEFAEEYQALNKVRNCLEHRDGIVGVSDADENGVLRLILPRMEIVVAHDDGTESPVVIGQETRGGRLLYRRGQGIRTYAIGEAIEFDAKDFAEIAQSCVFFGSDLASKLPGGDQVGGAA